MSNSLVGRDTELATVESFLDNVPLGAHLDLEGEPGIGKTALWSEACERARRRGYRVLSSRPGQLETALAYAALGDLLEGVLDEALLAVAAPRRRALERALLRIEDKGTPPDQRGVSLALRDALRALAADSLVVAIDDVQWLDASSKTALVFALRRLDEAHVGLLTTRRIDPIATEPQVGLAAGAVPSQRIHLAPLDETEVDDLVRTTLGAPLSRPALREVHRVSAGNPFFALELAREALGSDTGTRGAEHIPLPRSLRAILGDRIADLSSDVRELLVVVAAASQPTVSLVETVVGSRQRAFDLLTAAVGSEILQVERGRLRFRHPLLASAVYDDATEAERRRVHMALANETADVEERAHHLAQATDLPHREVAGALDEAAGRALARGAPAAAAGFAEQALRLTHDKDVEAIARRTTAAADAFWSAGETARARTLLEDLASALTPGTERAGVLRKLARARAYDEGFVAVLDPLERALAEVGDDLQLRAALERDTAFALMNAGDVRQAAAHAEAALDAAARLEDPHLAADVRTTHDAVRFVLGCGTPADLSSHAHELAFVREELDPQPGMLARAQILASMLKWSDDFSAARSVLEELRRRLDEREEEGPLVPILFHLGELECWSGNVTQAEAIARALETNAGRLGSGPRSQAFYLSALVAAVRGDADGAEAAATRGLQHAEAGREVRHVIRNLKVLGFLALSLDDAARAHAPLTRATDLAAANGYVDPGFFRVAADAVEARVGVGELERAERDAAELEALGRRLDRAWALATGARSRGLAAAARGDLDAAVAALEQALSAHERLPEPLERGRTLLALGSVHRQARRKRVARETLAQAVAVFEAIPAPLWARRARREAARIGGRIPAGGDLSETESRIAELVSEGRSNAEVARALFISRKTVEWNLSNVYRKLGVRSRTELARRSAAGDR